MTQARSVEPLLLRSSFQTWLSCVFSPFQKLQPNSLRNSHPQPLPAAVSQQTQVWFLWGEKGVPSLQGDSNPPSVLAPSPLPQCPIVRVSSPDQGSSGVPRTPHQSRKLQPPARRRRGVVAPGFGGGTGALAAAAPGQLTGHKPTGAWGETDRLGPGSGKARATASIEISNTTLRHGAKMLVPADFARFSRLQPCPAQTRAYSRACALGYTKTRMRHAGPPPGRGFGLS